MHDKTKIISFLFFIEKIKLTVEKNILKKYTSASMYKCR